ncbi:TcmI family type II polyketide cyclase [Phytohabitans sp. LJ34]|uniref:TcmI family type II polyketide cyclase n=1 Tax=Phytohabitans sp. LJ34 TaxID=3452217 RepID=UPI003F8A3ECC
MSYRGLMVMRMEPQHAGAVAELFTEHDKGDMPHVVGISRRTLFRYQDLYMHLIEADTDVYDKLLAARARDDFQDVNRRLATYLQRYAPERMSELRDSTATPFYTWTPETGSIS